MCRLVNHLGTIHNARRTLNMRSQDITKQPDVILDVYWNLLYGFAAMRQRLLSHWPFTRYVKLRAVHASGMPGTFPRGRLQRKPLVSNPDMHHDTCVTHVPWCMSGSISRGGGENVPGITSACAPASLPIWQMAHCGSILKEHLRSYNRTLMYNVGSNVGVK